MSLRSTFEGLVARARQAGGHFVEAELQGGAILRVRADAASDRIMLVISRRKVPLAEKEIETFCDHCRIPPAAERRPAEGQERIPGSEGRPDRYRVAFTWDQPRSLFETELFGE